MNVIKLDEEFTYDIEYEWHGGSHPIKMTTPTVMSSRMNITEKDLPLNVIIYAAPIERKPMPLLIRQSQDENALVL